MTTAISETRLMAYFDGVLSAAECAEIDALLEDDPQARALLEDWERQNAALGVLYDAVAQEPLPERLAAITQRARVPKAHRAAQLAAALALLAIGGLGGWQAARMSPAPAAVQFADAALAAHETFVVEVAHPVEVGADNSAHLVGWVSKRLGHEIAPPDFSLYGFALIGGRILPGAAGPAALFMYENETGRRITLFVAAPDAARETAFQFERDNAFQSFYWTDRALSYAVVGDIPRATLRDIANAAYEQLI